MRLSAEAKLGLFVFIGAVAFALTILIFGEIPLFEPEKKGYSAIFDDVAGLSVGAEVRVAGIKSGKVTGFKLENGKVRVFFELEEGITVYKDAVASIGTLGFMGDKYLAIYPGTPSAGILKEGEELKYISKVSDMDYLIRELTITSRNISELTKDLAEIIRENKENINMIIVHLEKTLETTRKLTENINRLIVQNEKHINETARNINELTLALRTSLPELLEDVKDISKQLEAILEENRDNIRKSSDNIAKFTQKLKEISEKIDNIVTKVEKGEGFLGKVIHDEKMYEDIQSGVSLFSEMSRTVTRTVFYVGMRGEAYKDWDGKGIFTVKVQPDDKKYYLLELVGDSRGRVYVEEVSNNQFIVRKQFEPEITLQYARIFNTPVGNFVVRGGLKESTGGVGFDLIPAERFKLFSDVWDFGRRNPLDGNEMSPNLQVGIRARLKGPLYITLGGDELLNENMRGAFLGAGLMFTDNDLKYMLGGLSLPLP